MTMTSEKTHWSCVEIMKSKSSRKAQVVFIFVLCFFTFALHSKLSLPLNEGKGTIFPYSGYDVDETSEDKLYNNNNALSATTRTTSSSISTDEDITRLDNNENLESVWTYRCDVDWGCLRVLREEGEVPIQQNVCWLNCGSHGALWPYPSGNQTVLGKCLVAFKSHKSIQFYRGSSSASLNSQAEELLGEMIAIFLRQVQKMQGHESKYSTMENNNKISIELSMLGGADSSLTLDTDESYTLSIDSDTDFCNSTQNNSVFEEAHVEINAATIYGARHALETLTQLIAYDNNRKCFQMVSEATIDDAPAYPYRGILLDSARNFIPIPSLERMIDAMSYSKLNMFHWHLTDSNSFPLYSISVPQMTKYGAYDSSKIYYPKDIKKLVLYGKARGVKIIPELDAPAHAGNGWQWGPSEGLGDLALCVNAEPWRAYCGQPPCGQLNPTNLHTLNILEQIYGDMLQMFDADLFHMGGDEVYKSCWMNNPTILKSIGNQSFMDLWGKFQMNALERLHKANSLAHIRPIVWTSGMTATPEGRKYLNASEYIIQVWETADSLVIKDLLKENYNLIMSPVDFMYLDHGAGSWLGKDHIYEYKNWQILYDNGIKIFVPIENGKDKLNGSAKQILGGEATMWSEKVNSQNIDSKMWPRGSVIAENLWSAPKLRTPLVYSRLNHHNNRLIERGIHADALQPESCYLSGHCDDPLSAF